MKKNSKISLKTGQTLITLLVFIVVAVSITTAATMILFNSSLDASKLQVGTSALQVAQSGVDNAMIRLLRDQTYTGETNLSVGTGSVTVQITPGVAPTPYVIYSTGQIGNFVRKIKVTVGDNNGKLEVTPGWQEIP